MLGKEVYTNFAALKKARAQIKKCNLIFTTCIGAGLGLLREETFDTVIIDEASQQTEPESLVPLVKGCQKAILVGDHVQLRATVQQHAILAGYDVSLFERLYKKDNESRSNGISKVMLDTQYRMHRSICHFSSTEFYEGRLLTGTSASNVKLTMSEFPWPADGRDYSRTVFAECSTPEDLGKKSKSNQGQAELGRKICDMLCQPSRLGGKDSKDLVAQTIAVLTPYSRQAELLQRVLSHLPNVEVSSIDGFQGREADIVVFVTVRCNAHYEIGFLKDLRRMNVALTRAKAGLIVIGDRKTLTLGNADEESTAVWKRLLRQLIQVRFDG
jgi:superfamily I DNA and/or RNA helicase